MTAVSRARARSVAKMVRFLHACVHGRAGDGSHRAAPRKWAGARFWPPRAPRLYSPPVHAGRPLSRSRGLGPCHQPCQHLVDEPELALEVRHPEGDLPTRIILLAVWGGKTAASGATARLSSTCRAATRAARWQSLSRWRTASPRMKSSPRTSRAASSPWRLRRAAALSKVLHYTTSVHRNQSHLRAP